MTAFYTDLVQDAYQRPIPGVQVLVLTSAGAEVALTTEGGSPIDNPVTTDAAGRFSFYAADGVYGAEFRYGGVTIREDDITVGNPPQYIGPPGPSNNTRNNLAALKAAAITDKTSLYDGSPWYWETANAPYTADDANIVKADSTALSVGAWVRQSSGGITFEQLGTGTIRLNVQDELRRPVTPQQFGAIGDGVSRPLSARFATLAAAQAEYPFATSLTQTQDWAGCQAAIKYVESLPTYGAVHVVRGRFMCGASKLVITQPIKMIGDGRKISTFWFDTNSDGLDVSFASSSHGLQLQDFGIVNGGAQVGDFTDTTLLSSVTSGTAMRLHNVAVAEITNIRMAGFYRGVHSTSSAINKFYSLHVEGFVDKAILFDGNSNYNSKFYACIISSFAVGDVGISLVDKCDSIYFFGGEVSMCAIGIQTDAASYFSSARPAFCGFVGIDIDRCGTGLDLAYCVDMLFQGCFISCDNDGALVGVNGPTANVHFSATRFRFNGRSAIIMGPDHEHTIIEACPFISNGATTPSTYDTIVAQAGFGPFTLVNSPFTYDASQPTAPRRLLDIAATGSDRYIITGNQFQDGNAQDKNVADARVGANRRIHGNIGYTTQIHGTATIATGQTTVSVNHNLSEAPTAETVTSRPNTTPPLNEWAYVSAVSATQITFTIATAATANRAILWQAYVPGN